MDLVDHSVDRVLDLFRAFRIAWCGAGREGANEKAGETGERVPGRSHSSVVVVFFFAAILVIAAAGALVWLLRSLLSGPKTPRPIKPNEVSAEYEVLSDTAQGPHVTGQRLFRFSGGGISRN